MRNIFRNILLAGGLLLGMQTAAHAGPILVVTNGILMGAQGVQFDGHTYDVSFSDARPTTGNLGFFNFDDSYAAADALDRLVFQGLYDTSPGRTNGCSNPLSCLVVTAYDFSFLGVHGVGFTNTSTRYVDPIIPYIVVGNAANGAGVTYAHWSLQEERQAVPEPSSLLLAGIGVAAMLAPRLRRRGAAAVA